MNDVVAEGKSFRITTTGLARIDLAINELRDIEKNRAIKAGLRNMGNTLVRGGKSRLKARLHYSKGAKGLLIKNFKVKVKRDKPGVLVGFDRGGNHSHLVDQGTTKRYHKGGKSVGTMPANHFWQDTAEQDINKASEALFLGIERATQRILSRR